jgi:hypothetical protein
MRRHLLLCLIGACLMVALPTVASSVCECPFQGDYDADGFLTAVDLSALIDVLFGGRMEIWDPDCPASRGDLNYNGFTDVLDLNALIDHLFAGGSGPWDPCGPKGTTVGFTDCKGYAALKATEDMPPDQDCVEYQYDGESVLLLKHVNAGFNCCPDSFAAEFHIQAGRITIDEIEWLTHPCYCLCLFDLDYQITGLPPGEYTIRAVEPYLQEGDEILEFTVDLVSSPSGAYCVQRDRYPWGIP